VPALNQLAVKSYKGQPYSEWVHIVHVYVIEPHPQAPDISPYSGAVWTMSYSTKGQPKTYSDRVANAKSMLPILQGNGTQLVLVDDLTPGTYNNPAWCTYGPCPNCSFLIGKDGKLVEVITKTPSNLAALESSMLKLLQ
jgi:hypothetical protein